MFLHGEGALGEALGAIMHAAALARELKVRGLINIQFAVKGDEIFVLEANPRASRTVPFVAKAVGAPIARIAAKVMAGASLTDFDLSKAVPRRIAVKEAVFPFARFPGVDPALGPEKAQSFELGLSHVRSNVLAAGDTLDLRATVFQNRVRD